MEETSGLERTSVGVRTARDGHETCRQFKLQAFQAFQEPFRNVSQNAEIKQGS